MADTAAIAAAAGGLPATDRTAERDRVRDVPVGLDAPSVDATGDDPTTSNGGWRARATNSNGSANDGREKRATVVRARRAARTIPTAYRLAIVEPLAAGEPPLAAARELPDEGHERGPEREELRDPERGRVRTGCRATGTDATAIADPTGTDGVRPPGPPETSDVYAGNILGHSTIPRCFNIGLYWTASTSLVCDRK